MVSNHFLFAVFIGALLLAPKLPLTLAGLPLKTGISPAVFFLPLWALASPGYLFRTPVLRNSAVSGLLIFTVYGFCVSVVSMEWVSMLYAAQYLVYATLGAVLLQAYLDEAVRRGELNRPLQIMTVVVTIFAFGIIVSVWTGPFFPHQTQWTEREWNGLTIQRGAGFADGVNTAAATLLMTIPFLLYVYAQVSKWAFPLGILGVLALFATLSRGAIVALVVSFGVLTMLAVVRAMLRLKVNVRSVRRMIFRGMACLIVAAVLFGLAFQAGFEDAASAVQLGVGLGGAKIVSDDFDLRAQIWEESLRQWMDGNVFELLFGLGFRMTGSLDDYSEAWFTPHNLYLAFLGDFGLLGSCLFMIALLSPLLRAGKRVLFFSEERPATIASFLILIALGIHNITEAFLYSPILLTLLLAFLLLAEQEQRQGIAVGRVLVRTEALR